MVRIQVCKLAGTALRISFLLQTANSYMQGLFLIVVELIKSELCTRLLNATKHRHLSRLPATEQLSTTQANKVWLQVS